MLMDLVPQERPMDLWYTLNPTPFTPNPARFTLHPQPYQTLNTLRFDTRLQTPTPEAKRLAPNILNPTH